MKKALSVYVPDALEHSKTDPAVGSKGHMPTRPHCDTWVRELVLSARSRSGLAKGLNKMRKVASIVLAALVLVAVASGTFAVSGPQADDAAVLNSAVEQGVAQAADESQGVAESGGETAKPGCKRCKGRPWCECTYNGAPRISCNPCCYATQPYPTCFD